MLLLAKKLYTNVMEVDITMVYIDGNHGMHFRALRDSIEIFMVLIRFSFISLLLFVVDILLFTSLYYATGAIMLSTYAARVLSGAFNFFSRSASCSGVETPVPHYFRPPIAALAFVLATVSGFGVGLAASATGVAPALVKLVIGSMSVLHQLCGAALRSSGSEPLRNRNYACS